MRLFSLESIMPSASRLAAVIYADGESSAADDVLAEIVNRLLTHKVRLAGTIQTNTDDDQGVHCAMTLEDLSTGEKFDISDNRGKGARGCKLNVPVFEALVGQVQAGLRSQPDLVIVNRFGKREAEGRGFRDVIAQATGQDIPVLVAMNESSRGAWKEFTAGDGAMLPATTAAVWRWCMDNLKADADAASSGS